jgi:transcriptional regulator with XRE-family HTH domain
MVRISIIAKHRQAGRNTQFARLLGSEIKRRRVELRLSQAEVGWPLSRAFLSSVESGRMAPSLPSLVMIAKRLNSSAAAILASVESELEDLVGDGGTEDAALPR